MHNPLLTVVRIVDRYDDGDDDDDDGDDDVYRFLLLLLLLRMPFVEVAVFVGVLLLCGVVFSPCE